MRQIDAHGLTRDEFEKLIDSLVVEGDVVEIIVGHGKGVLKKALFELSCSCWYDYKILLSDPTKSRFIVDFTLNLKQES